METRKGLLDSLKGTEVIIPNLYDISDRRLQRYLTVFFLLLIGLRLTLSTL
jgi:hypothetical protein